MFSKPLVHSLEFLRRELSNHQPVLFWLRMPMKACLACNLPPPSVFVLPELHPSLKFLSKLALTLPTH